MESLIKNLEKVSLSGDDTLKIIEGKSNLISYDQLKGVKHIKDIMKHGACIILYLSEEHYGHWVCVFYRSNKLIEFFDAYGVSVDLEKDWVKKETQKKLGVCDNYLSRLLANSGCEIEYNHHVFQKKNKSNISTCGRWVAVRLMFRDLSLEEFAKLFPPNKKLLVDGDMLVTLMTTDFAK